MTVLSESQFELAGAPVFGRGCPVEVTDVSFGAPDIEAGDQDHQSRDGTAFGRDRHAGAMISFELATNADDAAGALASWNALASAWNDPALREDPRAVTSLRLRAWGGQTRIVYGRPRKWEPANTQDIRSGLTKHVADFRTSDSTYYSDTLYERQLTLAPALGGGITYPITYPIQYGPVSTVDSHTIEPAGDRETWPVVEFQGPLVNPSITFLSTGVRFQVLTSLTHTQTLTVDTRPWAQTVRRSDGTHLRGKASPVPMRRLALPPGQSTVVQFTGQDVTGSSRCTVRWRDAYTTPGGATL